MTTSVGEIWSDLDHRFVEDGQGALRKVTNVESVLSSIDNILKTNPGERCFSGGTKIPLLSGKEVTIKDLCARNKPFWVFSVNCENLKIEPALAWAKNTGKQELFLVTLDDDSSFKCTKDHLLMLRNGHFREAGKTRPGQSLMPFYLRLDGDGYFSVFEPHLKEYVRVHRLVGEWKYGKIGKENCIHHKDFCKTNNEPGNLCNLKNTVHFKYHSKHAKEWNQKLWRTEEYAWFRKFMESGVMQRKIAENPEFGKAISEGLRRKLKDPKERKIWSSRCSDTLKKTWEDPKNREIFLKTLSAKGKAFWADPNNFEKQQKSSKARKEGRKKYEETAEAKTLFLKRGEILGKNQALFKLKKHYPIVLQQFSVFAEETWESYRKQQNFPYSYPTWKTIISKGYLKELVLNHKIKDIKSLGVTEDVFDLYVPGNNNFAISAGVFVHNCMLPTFGSPLRGIVFEDMNSDSLQFVSDRIQQVIEAWDNRVKVQEISFYRSPDDNAVSLDIKFQIRGHEKVFQYKSPVEENGSSA